MLSHSNNAIPNSLENRELTVRSFVALGEPIVAPASSNVEGNGPCVFHIVTAQRYGLLPKRIGACKRQELLHWKFKKFHAPDDEVEPFPLQWHKTDALVVRHGLNR